MQLSFLAVGAFKKAMDELEKHRLSILDSYIKTKNLFWAYV